MKLKTGERFKDFLGVIYTVTDVSQYKDKAILYREQDGLNLIPIILSLDNILLNLSIGTYSLLAHDEVGPSRLGDALNDFFKEYDREADLNRPTQTCNHTWKAYVGLNETFDYCSKCDEKK